MTRPRSAEIPAARILSAVYGTDGVRFSDDGTGAADFTLADGSAVEVKLITLESRHSVERAWSKHVMTGDGLLLTDELHDPWLVTLELPSRGGHDLGPVDLRTFRSDVVGWLAALEGAGLDTNRGLGPAALYQAPLSSAVRGLRCCLATAHRSERGGAVDFSMSHGGYVPPGPAPVLAAVEGWLNGEEPQATKLRQQLGSRPGQRHAFLVLGSAVPEQWNLLDPALELPDRPPMVPDEVDVIWIYASGDHAWRWAPETGWEKLPAP